MSVTTLPIMPHATQQRLFNEFPVAIYNPMYVKCSWVVSDLEYAEFLSCWRYTSKAVMVLDFDKEQLEGFSLEDAYRMAVSYSPSVLILPHFLNNVRDTIGSFNRFLELRASLSHLSAVQFMLVLESSNCSEAIRMLNVYKNFRRFINSVGIPDHVEWPVPYMDVTSTSYTESRLRCLKRWSLFQQVCNGARVNFHLLGIQDPFEVKLYRGSQIFSCSSDIAYVCAVNNIKFEEEGLEVDRPIGGYSISDPVLNDTQFATLIYNLQWLEKYSPVTTKGVS